ncbi:MAG: ATP-binding protein [Pseudomonadota bacterium]
MVNMERVAYKKIIKELSFKNGKMAFITGPRQVGKTTLSEQLLAEDKNGSYYNWDDVEFRRKWIKDPKAFIPETIGEKKLIVFDELHKAPRWKSYLKGLYDTRKEFCNILVTGSARLDIFRKGGDSLLGRYFLFRLHPFSLGELCNSDTEPEKLKQCLEEVITANQLIYQDLMKYGGFPDAFLKKDQNFLNAWQRMRRDRVIREDLIDLTKTHELSLIETAAALIPERIGSPFSIQSLAEDLEVSHPTTKRWINWLSQLFYIYVIPPFNKKIARSLKKQPKIYLWDWSEIKDEAVKFENLVASHLLKAAHFWTDSGIGTFDLYYLRDKEKKEVDFLMVKDKKPWLMVECKLNDVLPAPSLKYFSSLLAPEITLQLVSKSGIHKLFDLNKNKKGYIISADQILTLLP